MSKLTREEWDNLRPPPGSWKGLFARANQHDRNWWTYDPPTRAWIEERGGQAWIDAMIKEYEHAKDDRLVKRYKLYDVKHMADVIACLAANLEEAYILAGVPDYTAKHCVDLVAGVVLQQWLRDAPLVKALEFHFDTTRD